MALSDRRRALKATPFFHLGTAPLYLLPPALIYSTDPGLAQALLLVSVVGFAPISWGIAGPSAARNRERKGQGPNMFFAVDVEREKRRIGPLRYRRLQGRAPRR